MAKTPRFTDSHRFPFEPYTDAKGSQEPNYLRDKFARIRERQQKDEQEVKDKVRRMRK